jgi:hypothetical protein
MKYALLAAFALTACATNQSEADKVVPLYLDKPIIDVVQKWGVPKRIAKGEGGKVYIWEDQPPARNCRVEAHVNDRQNVIGLFARGGNEACVVWWQALHQ